MKSVEVEWLNRDIEARRSNTPRGFLRRSESHCNEKDCRIRSLGCPETAVFFLSYPKEAFAY